MVVMSFDEELSDESSKNIFKSLTWVWEEIFKFLGEKFPFFQIFQRNSPHYQKR